VIGLRLARSKLKDPQTIVVGAPPPPQRATLPLALAPISRKVHLGRVRWLPKKHFLVNEQYYLPWLGFRSAGEWFDSLGNLLAILSGVADERKTATILDFIDCHNMAAWFTSHGLEIDDQELFADLLTMVF